MNNILNILFSSSNFSLYEIMSVQKSNISSLLPFLILSIVVGSARSSEGRDGCSSSCGSQSFGYPFHLRGDPAICGPPEFELICDGNNKTILELYGGRYYVIDIDFIDENMSGEIHIVDANSASGECKLPFPLPFRSLIHSSYATVFRGFMWISFVNCSNKVQDDRYLVVPCLSGNNAFVYVIQDDYRVGALFPSCRILTMTGVPAHYRGNSEAEVFRSLKEGFTLHWATRPKTPRMTINYCLKQTLWLNIDMIQVYYWTLGDFVRGFYPLPLASDFVDCLKDYEGPNHITSVTMAPALVFIICLNVAIYLLEIAIFVRFLVAPLPIFVFLAYECWKLMVPIDSVEKFLRNQQTLAPTRYTYVDIIAMTRHFKEKLGQGGFGTVYKGELPGGNFVAIKMLGSSKCNGEDFINEVSTIGTIHHLNVVRLVGFCADGSNRALVYEFMPNGSLDKYIFSSNRMHQQFTKEKLNEIALGVARGVDYLHQGCDMRILHFDIKPHNILLDHNFNPKVSDFGLAKLYSRDYSLVSISVARGTIGYMAPELVSRSFGVISHKSDVYSFGMLLMEMAGGRRNVNQRAENSSQVYYPSWIYDRLLQNEGPEICNSFEIDDMERKLCKVGLWCIQMRPSDRPSMSRVIEMLEADDVHTLQMPPKPFFSTSEPVSFGEICMHSSSELSTISEDE